MPLQIGITGGIGSGKSLVCKIFRVLGVPTYDADSRAKDLMTTDGILVSAIKKEFGELSYDQHGALNRQYLADRVFNRKEELAKLNSLVHPRVGIDYTRWSEAQKFPYVLKEAALLFESSAYKSLDKIIVVSAPNEIRMARVLGRDKHRTAEQIASIMRNQMPEDDKLARADFVITNDETHPVIPQVLDLHRRFLMLAS
ncbi:dephospho-CoA kinase [Pseudochryseolinea flava]|uniref:Dephospho-CoA kinase n=1 Tax=Pseudochryseolinea flava TaxID=2059302 RepID=A0A364Y889_9BACT|nr:dephospho-CoA kinase [Pseudochryseolinea flava]RAW03301.1 dephospho-CoA kinase [Pseudochryseolinea flava]